MPTDTVLERMLTTVIDNQTSLASEVKQIKDDMSKLILIEERQINQKEAL